MSLGEIIEHIGEGKYRVRQKLAVERIQQELQRVGERLAELAIELPTRKLELLQAENAASDKVAEIDQLIPDLQAGVAGARAEIAARQTELVAMQASVAQLRRQVAELTAEDLSNRKRQNQLQQIPEGRELDVWCADYSLSLSGGVGLVDINDEGGQGVLIQPGFEDEAAYDAGRDGGLFPNLAQSGAQIYFNTAVMPGVQKWRPRYRLATVTQLAGDICNVELDPAASSVQALNINQSEALEQVPIKYMDCNGAAFEVGDRVLVRFTQAGPLVIGFAENPRSCVAIGFAFIPARPVGSMDVRFWGEPLEDEFGNPINPPLGTIDGSNPSWFMRPEEDGWLIERGNESLHGRRNWVGNRDDDILSWDGPSSREFNTYYYDLYPSSLWGQRTAPGGSVYHKGRVLMNSPGFPYVRGACFLRTEDALYLIMVVSDNFLSGTRYQMWSVPLNPLYEEVGPATQIGFFDPAIDEEYWPVSDWYFNASGTQAVCTFIEKITLSGGFEVPGKAMYVGRWNVDGTTQLEKLSDEGDEIGHRYQEIAHVSTGAFFSGEYTTSGTTTRYPLLQPIYADFIGDEEVIAYLELQQSVSSSSSSRVSEFETVTGENGGSSLVGSGTQQSNGTVSYSGHNRIVLSNGDTLLDFGVSDTASRSLNGSWSSVDGQATGGSASVSDYERYVEPGAVYGIDARFGFVVADYRMVYQSSIGSGPFVGDGYQISGSEVYESDFYIKGVLAGESFFDILFYEEDSFQSGWTRTVLYAPDVPSYTELTDEPIERGVHGGFSPGKILDCCGIQKGGRQAISVQIYKEESNTGLPGNLVRFHYITGYPDPEISLFQNPGQNMTMYSLTLF